MKNIVKLLFAFMFGFFLISNVNAATPKVKLNVNCSTSSTTFNKKIVCSPTVYVSNNDIENMKIKATIATGPARIYYEDLMPESSFDRGTSDLGNIYLETGSTRGSVKVVLNATNIKYDGVSLSNVSTYATIKVKSNVNTLSSIKVDGTLIPRFSKNTTSYQTSTTKNSATIGATPTSAQASVTGTGTKSLSCGANTFYLKVKSEYGSYKSYKVTIDRKCDKNVYLSGIAVSEGKLTPEFVKTTTSYTVKVDKDVKTISVTGQKASNTQKVTGNVNNKALKYGSNKINITVTNQTGSKQVYKVNVIREDKRDKNAFLSSLSLSDGSITFDKKTFEYETKVLNKIDKIEVLAIPEQETSIVTIKGADSLKEGENTITIEVKSEAGTKQVYKVKVTRLKDGESLGDNANIKNIIIKGHNLKFEYSKANYKVIIEKENSLDITVVTEDPTATYEIIGNKDLKDESVIKIVTKALDGTTKTYTINITKPSYTIYYVLGAILLGLVIAVPAVVYFKSVKAKEVKKDVNGYVEGKEYEDTTKGRQVMGKVTNVITDTKKPTLEPTQNPVVEVEQVQVKEESTPIEIKTAESPNEEPAPIEIKTAEPLKEQPVSEEAIPLIEVKEPTEQPKKSVINKKENKELKLETPLKAPKTNVDQTTDKNGFDTELQDYIPNVEGEKCPHCGRELLGNPENCPYCKKSIK